MNNYIIDMEIILAILEASYEHGQYLAEEIIPQKLRSDKLRMPVPILDRIAQHAVYLCAKKYIRHVGIGTFLLMADDPDVARVNPDDIKNVESVNLSELTLEGYSLYYSLRPHKQEIQSRP